MVKLFRYYLMAYVLRSGLLGHILDELYDDITSSYLSRLIWLLWGLCARLDYIDMHAYLRFMDCTLGRLIGQQVEVALGWHN